MKFYFYFCFATIILISMLIHRYDGKYVDIVDSLNAYIDSHQTDLIERLRTAITIKSVSSQSEYRNDTIYMMEWMAHQMRKLNISVQLIDIGFENKSSGQPLPLPPVLLGELIQSNFTIKKKTLCVYGHLDVQPAIISDGWKTDPFVMIQDNSSLFGRGISDVKGPAIGWINAIQAYQQLGIELPVNLKFIFEAMEESSSLGLEKVLRENAKSFLSDIDYVAINDDVWLSNTKPSLKYGQRGLVEFEVAVQCATRDLHSGTYGGVVREVMTDLIIILRSLVHENGTILIPGIMNDIRRVTIDELKQYSTLSFNEKEFQTDIGSNDLNYHHKLNTLMHLWRLPSLSIHGIEGVFSEHGFKSVIPAKAIAKFSIRTVPNQKGKDIQRLVTDYLNQIWIDNIMNYGNNFTVTSNVYGEPWITNPDRYNFLAARRAIKTIYGVDPDLAMSGNTDPIANILEEVSKASVVMLSMGKANSGMHSQNEKLDIINYINGTKLMAAYFYEISKL